MTSDYYGKNKHQYMLYRDDRFAEYILSLINDDSFSKFESVIELGAGMGRFSAPIIQNFSKITIVEPVTEYVKILKTKFTDNHVNIINSSAEVFLADHINDKPSLVFCFHLMHHLTYEQRKTIYIFIKETGSKCVLVEPNAINPLILIQTLMDPDMTFAEEKQYLTLTNKRYKKEIESNGLALTSFKRFCIVPPVIANTLLITISKDALARLEALNTFFPFMSSYQLITFEGIA